jgi:hypothetical protein
VNPYQPPGLWEELAGGKGYVESEGDGLYRRSLYSYWRRTVAPPNMVNFDSPTRETCVVRESRTNTPLQALNLMNDVAYLEAARKLGERMLRRDDGDRISYGFRLTLAREPSSVERAALEEALGKFSAFYREHPAEAKAFLKHGKSAPHAKADAAALASYAAVAGILLNMDETITKE